MTKYSVDTNSIITSSKRIVSLSEDLQTIGKCIEDVEYNVIGEKNREKIAEIIEKYIKDASDEAAQMNSLASALKLIADRYQNAEDEILTILFETAKGVYFDNTSTSGTDKRSWFKKFWDWITNRKPDNYDATDNEQEKAADAEMRKKLWNVLQNEMYSTENWDNASVEERKVILQNYMNEVIVIYGLKDVRSSIKWDNDAIYTSNSIVWGYYSHYNHTVTLNEQALSDSFGNWDSYDLLETVSHELRHAYQHEAINHPTDHMVSQETINIWRDNFTNYIQASENYQGYRDQPVEVDARSFQISRDEIL